MKLRIDSLVADQWLDKKWRRCRLTCRSFDRRAVLHKIHSPYEYHQYGHNRECHSRYRIREYRQSGWRNHQGNNIQKDAHSKCIVHIIGKRIRSQIIIEPYVYNVDYGKVSDLCEM